MKTSTTPRRVNGVDVDALAQTIEAIRSQPELGAAQFRGTSLWLDDRRVTTAIDRFDAAGGTHSRAIPHELPTDLPGALMGTDEGPSPLELALSALSSCVTTTLVAHASAKGLELDSLTVVAVGDLDLQGFLNLADVPVGYSEVKLGIDLRADRSADEIQSFVDSGLRFSPVFHLFLAGSHVTVERMDLAMTPQG